MDGEQLTGRRLALILRHSEEKQFVVVGTVCRAKGRFVIRDARNREPFPLTDSALNTVESTAAWTPKQRAIIDDAEFVAWANVLPAPRDRAGLDPVEGWQMPPTQRPVTKKGKPRP